MKLDISNRVRANLHRIGAINVAIKVAHKYRLPLDAVLDHKGQRRRTVCRARTELVALVHWTLGHSLHETGSVFAMDHTSVMAALRRREKAIAS